MDFLCQGLVVDKNLIREIVTVFVAMDVDQCMHLKKYVSLEAALYYIARLDRHTVMAIQSNFDGFNDFQLVLCTAEYIHKRV